MVHQVLYCNNFLVCKIATQSGFAHWISNIANKNRLLKSKKLTVFFKKPQQVLYNSCNSLLVIYCFKRPYLGFGDVIYGQRNKKSFCQKIEKIHYQFIMGAIKKQLYRKFGIKSFNCDVGSMLLLFKADFKWSQIKLKHKCIYLKVRNCN